MMATSLPSQTQHDHSEDEAETIPFAKASQNEQETPAMEECFVSHWSWSPLPWFRMLAKEMHWSFVFGVIAANGISQGLGTSIAGVATDYYWKDVQLVQPSVSQFYQGISSLPWIVKPLWGILTDVLPFAGYRRRPYLVLAGLLGIISMAILSLHSKLHVMFALLAMTVGSAAVVIADVTMDACIAESTKDHPSLAADMQSLCVLSESIGGLFGYSISGLLVHAIGPQGVLGLITIPSAVLLSVGIMLKEVPMSNFTYRQVCQKFRQAIGTLWQAMQSPDVWRPCIYMYLSFALSLDISGGMFYWYTDTNSGLSLSQESIGFIYSVGSIGALLAMLLFQLALKDYPYRSLLFWSQILSSLAGMLDLVLVLRLNLRIGMPDYLFVVIDQGISNMIRQFKWLPLLVLSSKLCPSGVEGTFFALLMSVDNFGLLTSSWGGGLLLHTLKVTRTEFDNLWAAILVRNLMRLLPLAVLFLVPKGDQNSVLLPQDFDSEKDNKEGVDSLNDIEMVALVEKS